MPYDTSTPMYILNNPALYWIPTNKTDMLTLNNTIIINALGGIQLMIGRVKVGNYTTIGKVHFNQGYFGCYYWQGQGGEAYLDKDYDVLACKT
jgi:hypothetical protein